MNTTRVASFSQQQCDRSRPAVRGPTAIRECPQPRVSALINTPPQVIEFVHTSFQLCSKVHCEWFSLHTEARTRSSWVRASGSEPPRLTASYVPALPTTTSCSQPPEKASMCNVNGAGFCEPVGNFSQITPRFSAKSNGSSVGLS